VTKIICVGDIHAMDRPPKNATESYMDDIIGMLLWIADYAKEHGIVHVVWAGDIFHHKQPSKTSHALVLRMIEVVRYHRKLGIDICAVTGNHDISNDVLASIKEKQPLGVLYKAGLRELSGWHPTAPLFGAPWQQNWTTSDSAAEEAFETYRLPPVVFINGQNSWPSGLGQPGVKGWDELAAHVLCVTHAPIYPPGEAEKQLFELVPTEGEHGISHAMRNVGSLYYGHIHEDHGVFEVEGVTYCNVGALSRGSLTEYNIEREIKMAVWDSETGFEEVVVPHRPAEEVLRVVEGAEEKADRLSLDNFLTEVGSSTLSVSTTGSVIEHIRGRADVSDRVKKTAIEILEEVE
jgi:Icc-related predicted phosphoesterase